MMGLVTNFCGLPWSRSWWSSQKGFHAAEASRPHCGIPWSRSWPSSQAQLKTVAQAILLFPETHEDPGCIAEFWASVVTGPHRSRAGLLLPQPPNSIEPRPSGSAAVHVMENHPQQQSPCTYLHIHMCTYTCGPVINTQSMAFLWRSNSFFFLSLGICFWKHRLLFPLFYVINIHVTFLVASQVPMSSISVTRQLSKPL